VRWEFRADLWKWNFMKIGSVKSEFQNLLKHLSPLTTQIWNEGRKTLQTSMGRSIDDGEMLFGHCDWDERRDSWYDSDNPLMWVI
jgi:hypothetical protein